ncbi:hypothetical protein BS78_08G024300 [Paspalum vaginatum]|nr:hypothetical protein BS78_08G024300 [Paspalum vaginatum]
MARFSSPWSCRPPPPENRQRRHIEQHTRDRVETHNHQRTHRPPCIIKLNNKALEHPGSARKAWQTAPGFLPKGIQVHRDERSRRQIKDEYPTAKIR